jgi:hypothetical protein
LQYQKEVIQTIFYKEVNCTETSPSFSNPSSLYYKPIMIVNDDARVVNKLEASLTDDARVVIYDCHMFIVQAIGQTLQRKCLNYGQKSFITLVPARQSPARRPPSPGGRGRVSG